MSRMDEYLMAIITGENEDLPEPRSGFEREFYEAAKKGLGGASSWNELTDRPFGETTVTGDTLTWDGNTEGLYSVGDNDTILLCRISEAAPTVEEYSCTIGVGEESLTWTSAEAPVEIIATGVQLINQVVSTIIVSEEAVGVDLDGLIIEKAGVYVMSTISPEIYSLTVKGCTDFLATQINTIPKKYLPDILYADSVADYIVETGCVDGWVYEYWKSGKTVARGAFEVELKPNTTVSISDNYYVCQDTFIVSVPTGISIQDKEITKVLGQTIEGFGVDGLIISTEVNGRDVHVFYISRTLEDVSAKVNFEFVWEVTG